MASSVIIIVRPEGFLHLSVVNICPTQWWKEHSSTWPWTWAKGMNHDAEEVSARVTGSPYPLKNGLVLLFLIHVPPTHHREPRSDPLLCEVFLDLPEARSGFACLQVFGDKERVTGPLRAAACAVPPWEREAQDQDSTVLFAPRAAGLPTCVQFPFSTKSLVTLGLSLPAFLRFFSVLLRRKG